MTDSQAIQLTDDEIEGIGYIMRDASLTAFEEDLDADAHKLWAIAEKVDPNGTINEPAPWEQAT